MPDASGKYTVEEVGARVRAKNPDAFAAFTDAQIGERVAQRNPKVAGLVTQKPTIPTSSLPDKAHSTASFLPGEVGRVGQLAYEGFKQLPVVKQASQLAGGAVGLAGGAVGGATGGLLGAAKAAVTGQPIGAGLVAGAKRGAVQTGKFGYDIGKEAAPAALTGAAGKLVNVPLAATQVASGAGKLREGDIKGGLVDIGLGALSTRGAIKDKGLLVNRTLEKTISGTAPLTPSAARKKQETAKDIIYAVIRPSQAEVRDFEIKKHKQIREIAGLIAKENEVPNITPENKMDWSKNVANQLKKVSDEHNQVNRLLEGLPPTKTVDFESVRQKAYKRAEEIFKNSAELVDAKKEIDDLIDADIQRYGKAIAQPDGTVVHDPNIHVRQSNDAKSGYWSVGYRADKPLRSRVSRVVGHELNDEISEKAGSILVKNLNASQGRRLDAVTLMTKATGRVIQKGRLGQYFAGVVGAMVGKPIPVIGPAAGYVIGKKGAEILQRHGTIRSVKKAGKLMQRVESQAFPGPGAASAIEESFTGNKIVPARTSAPAFEGFSDLSTKILEKLKGRETVSKQFISDLTNSGDVKQAERDLVRRALEGEPETINVKKFAEKVKDELLPLRAKNSDAYAAGSRYEGVNLPSELRGKVENYNERIYESPVETSAGDVHFPTGNKGGTENYFAHTRIEDIPGDTRRVIELQSDLFQKGRLEQEKVPWVDMSGNETFDHLASRTGKTKSQLIEERTGELSKLKPYENTWHERVIREEVKKAAQDGKKDVLFPTGETAMKVEGLGDNTIWSLDNATDAAPSELEIGREIYRGERGIGTNEDDAWVITDVLGDGKFKAVPKDKWDYYETAKTGGPGVLKRPTQEISESLSRDSESFDISGKVDKESPIFKFYEKEVGKYLRNKYKATPFTDKQGVTWWRVAINPEMKKLPIEAFAAAPAFALPFAQKEKERQERSK